MSFSFLHLPSADPWIQALCWTLIHSLWQGLIAAILAGLLLTWTRKSSARLRYNLLALLFFGLVAMAAGTFGWEYSRSGSEASQEQRHSALTVSGKITTSKDQTVQELTTAIRGKASHDLDVNPLVKDGKWARFENYLNTHALYIVSAWLLILLIKLARTGVSLGHIRRLRHYKTSPSDGYWHHRVMALAEGIGLSRSVTLLQSPIVPVPMVIGILKPIILVPLGILSQLPPDQIEAVLLHELAHIRRMDYLVNLCQSLAESLLFFNPAVLWISALIREERENCCDDVAIGATRNKSQLIHALVAFQEFGEASIVFAVAFPGRKTHLLDRVKRIVYNRNKTLNAMEKVLLAGCLLIASSLTLAVSPHYRHAASRGILAVVDPSLLKKNVSRDTLPAVPPLPPVPANTPVPPTTPARPSQPPMPPVPPAPVPPPPVPPVPPIPPVPPPSPSLVTREMKDGNFKGTLDADGRDITYVRGIWTKGDTIKYFADNYIIVQENGFTKELYKADDRVPDEQLDSYKPVIQRIIDELKSNGYRSVTLNNRIYGKSAVSTLSIGSGDSSGSGYTIGTMDSAQGYGITINGGGYGGGSSEYGGVASGHGVSSMSGNGSTDSLRSASTSGYGSRSNSYSYSGQNISPDVSNDVARKILQKHLASDSTELTYSLDHFHLIVNNVRQPDSVFNDFKKYVIGNNDSIKYARKGGSIWSNVTMNN
jgi:beta-lactamase regulating signal transducer with metallopeptidase domain